MRMKAQAGMLVAAMLIGTLAVAGMQGTPSGETLSGTAAVSGHASTLSLHFSPPSVTEKGGYAEVAVPECTAHLGVEGAPMLPYVTHTFTFPLGTVIDGVEVSPGPVGYRPLTGEVASAPPAVSPSLQEDVQRVDLKEYTGGQTFPGEWMRWRTGVGLRDGRHVLFLVVQAFPARYDRAEQALQYVEEMNLEVRYTPGTQVLTTADEFDLLIVAPDKFAESLQPLVEHKDSYGVATQVVTLEEVYGGVFFEVQGRDEAERVKYFIKNAVEEWGVRYVMLVGGRNGGLNEEKWWCPVRYAHLSADSDPKFLSDLYFADIYKYDNDEVVFEDWDSNGNGLYAEWRFGGKDNIDMFPDVYVGRLACRNSYEVKVMVDKIITYETTAHGSDWANRYLGIGGDTFPGDQWYDGEEGVLKAMEYLEPLGMEFTTLFTSDGTLSEGQDIIDAVSQGCGFLNFEGHGNPMSWANHPPQDGNTWIGIDATQFMLFQNQGMYPVCVIGGCSNSKFNVSLLNLLKFNNLEAIIAHSDYAPESFGWWIVRAVDKGAIASIGCTSYGYGASGDSDGDGIFDGIQKRGGFIDIEFFRVYAQEGKDILGETHGTAITNFLLKFPPMTNQIDGKTAEEWVLLGDPSLKIGGYPS